MRGKRPGVSDRRPAEGCAPAPGYDFAQRWDAAESSYAAPGGGARAVAQARNARSWAHAAPSASPSSRRWRAWSSC